MHELASPPRNTNERQPAERTTAPHRTHRLSRRRIRRIDMTALVNFIHSIRRNDEGQDLLEYALLVALIAIVAVGAVTAAGNQVSAIFNQIATAI
jgi:pilus assembly protein Flp/PilA